MSVLAFTVSGLPATQGNHRTTLRGGRARLYDACKSLPAWRKAVREAATVAAASAAGTDWQPLDGPVTLGVTFVLARTRITKTGKLLRWKGSAPVARGTGDMSKLLRAVEDSLAGIAYLDDAQITYVVADKVWALDEEPAHARITVGRA